MEEEFIEVAGPPAFERGQKVRATRPIRSDGTFRGTDRGDLLIDEGEVGYIHGVGEFLQRHYIYDVDFYHRGLLVGMRVHELELVED